MVDKFERQIKRIFAPIVVFQGMEDMVTDYMKTKIEIERLSTPLAETATDYEAMIYLHTASLSVPFSERWYHIYSYLFSKYHPEQAKTIGVYSEQISEQEQHALSRLKKWIYRQQLR
ncbi:MAG: hypothetical protein NWE95_01890 [Candidatus Bathyarchaeota archaeon]|nr:hypothetical protein [Candidatus Bathyarchaeota archaeon]